MWHRKPVVAGAFYPAEKEVLSRMITGYIEKAETPELKGEVLAVISPHAGYIYSGPVAAYSFKAVRDMKPDVVIVLAPSHRARFDGASIIPSGIYETPLGEVPIDEKTGSVLNGRGRFAFIREAHEQEHSLEVQVPFLQSVLGQFSLVPIVVGSVNPEVCRQIADDLYTAISQDGRKFLIVISTDLSHYHSYDRAKKLDGIFIESLKSFSAEEIMQAFSEKGAEACGEGPILAGVMLARKLGGTGVEILRYGTSGETSGDMSQVVGYLSAAIVKQ